MHPIRAVVASWRPSRQPRMPWGRLNNLVDGIYAFSATLLMLKLNPPEFTEGRLGQALLDQAPAYLIYVLGFFQIIGAWSVLRRISEWTVGIDFYATLLCFVSLITWSTTPFTIDLMTDAVDNEDDFVAAVRLLALVVLASMIGYSGMIARLMRGGFFRADLDPDILRFAQLTSLATPLWPLATLVSSFVIGGWSLGFLVVLSLLTLVPVDPMSTEQYAEVD